MEIIYIQSNQVLKKQYGMDENGTLTEGIEGHVFISGAGDSLTKTEIEKMIFYSEMLHNLEDSRMRFTSDSHDGCAYPACIKALKKKVKSSYKEIADKKMHCRLTDTELAVEITTPVFREASSEEKTRALTEIKIWERWYFLDAESQLLAIFKNTLESERPL